MSNVSQKLLLRVQDLSVEFVGDHSVVRAVDRVSFDLHESEVLGIVGESGSGKSVTCMSIMGLLQRPPARIPTGSILFEGQDLVTLPEPQMRRIRGRDISMIFQDPFTSLNPYLKISTQLLEVLEVHSDLRGDAGKKRCLEVLEQLGVSEPDIRFNSYPHQLSGGLKQRMMIAMSLLLRPKILIADEPTTALDVTIQAQILELLKDINKKFGTAIIMITHDMGVVAGLCDRIQVMYGGRLAEQGNQDDIFYRTKHPYTKGLLESIPSHDALPQTYLKPIPGSPPDLSKMGHFCAFASRCSRAEDDCRQTRPPLQEVSKSHRFECFHPLNAEGAR